MHLFFDPEDIEFKETFQKRAEQVGIAYGSSYALGLVKNLLSRFQILLHPVQGIFWPR